MPLARTSLNLFVSLSLLLATPAPLFAGTPTRPTPTEKENSPALNDDLQLLYWGRLNQENPLAAEFALGEPISEQPLWKIDADDPLKDSNPFFMRSQQWSETREACEDCVSKNQNGDLELTFADKTLTIKEKFTHVLDTDDYIFLSADNLDIFRAKNNEEAPGEGLFFIAKKDIAGAIQYQAPLPIFFFPLPGEGWTGANDHAFELGTTGQLTVYSKDGFGLPIDLSDVKILEKVGRDNLRLAQTWSFLEGKVDNNGVALPKPGTTLVFGTLLSGVLPELGGGGSKRFAAAMRGVLLPEAIADEVKPTLLARLRGMFQQRLDEIAKEEKAASLAMGEQYDLPLQGGDNVVVKKPAAESVWSKWVVQPIKDYFKPEAKPPEQLELKLAEDPPPEKSLWRRWAAPTVFYGGTAALAVAAGQHVDWAALITADMPERITQVSEILGSVLVASVALKYSLHRAIFAKKYPKTPDETFWQRVNKEHKGIIDELTHGLWFSLAVTPQGIRHCLDFLKDRFFPSNGMLHKAWEATMGFQMRQSSRLPMNWKAYYLGLAFGMADAVMVGVDLLIFTPWIIHNMGWNLGGGVATAAFASATVLSQFTGYLQTAGHNYAADIKMLFMKSAENEARRKMTAQGLNPDAAKNDAVRNGLAQKELEKRFKVVGLPGSDEFLYDPITFLEWLTKKFGFAAEDTASISPEDAKKLAGKNFILKRRRWGLVKPALKAALKTAQAAQLKAPSETGAQTINLLKWAISDRSVTKAVAERAYDVTSSDWAAQEMNDAMVSESAEWIKTAKNPTAYGVFKSSIKGALKYLVLDSTQEARDIRMTLFLMSESGSPFDMAPYLPKKWKNKAGSEDAAMLGAELFHRAFYSFVELDRDMITADAQLEAGYGARAQQVMERVSRQNPKLLADPFARQVRYWELMSRLKDKDEERGEILDFKPKELSKTAQKQWDIARNVAVGRLADPVNADEVVTRTWLGLAENFTVKSGIEVDALDWAESYKYKLIVAQEISKQMGLAVNDVQDSGFVKKVVIEAAIATEQELANTQQKIYIDKMRTKDRKFYEAQIFSRHFINSYIDLSVRTDELLPASSPEYPGRFQARRRALVGVPGENIYSRVLRTFETLFRNEETSYAPGKLSWLDRNVPIVPDLYHNFIRGLRTMPYVLSLSYLTSYYIWQIHIPYPLWVVMVGFGFVHPTLVELSNRLMKNFGVKPMAGVPEKLTLSFIHSRLTNPEVMLLQAYAQPISDTAVALVETCEDLLLGAKKR